MNSLSTQKDLPLSDGSASADSFLTPRRFGLFLGVAIGCAFPQVVLGLHTFFYRDFGVLAYPMVFYHHESFWRAELPLWNPLSNCGAPFLAQWGTMALYPLSLFYLIFPLPWSLNFFCLAHLFWAGLGMYKLAERWVNDRFAASVAGTAFVFNGVTLSCLIWPNYTVALGWMPWVILAVERAWQKGGARLIPAGVIAALQMLAGVPEIALFTWLVVAVVGIENLLRGSLAPTLLVGRTAAIILLVSGLCAAQLLPFFELLAYSQRTADFATEKWSMPAWGWVNLIFPLFRCFLTPQGVFFQLGQEFLSSTYIGVAAVALGTYAVVVVRSRRVWMLAGLVLLSLWMALGENGLLYPWIKQTLPLVGFARYPIKFTVLAAFSLALLAAFGVKVLQKQPAVFGQARWRAFVLLCGGLWLAMGLAIEFTRQFPTPYDQWAAILKCGVWRTFFLIATVGMLGALTFGGGGVIGRRVIELGILTLIVLDLLTHVPNQNPTLPAYVLAPGLFDLQNKALLPKHGQGRVQISSQAEAHLLASQVADRQHDLLGKRLALWSNLNLLEGAPKVNGSSTLQIREQMEVQSLFYGSTSLDLPRLADFLAVKLHTAPGQVVEWTARDGAMPFVTGGQRPIFADAAETLRGLTNASFNSDEAVYLPRDSETFVAVTNRTQVRIDPKKFSAGRIDLDVSAEEAALIVIAQTFYPAWRAYVSGQPTRVWRANHAFQAIEVPKGASRVTLIYEDRAFRWGAALSLTTLLICIGFWLGTLRVRRENSPKQGLTH